jgi:PBSX family phage terminase large subunit
VSGPRGTGKSIGSLLKLYWVCRNYPESRCLLLRKTRISLNQSALLTWERDILGFSHPMLLKNPNLRNTRQAYYFPNRSELVVAGMDQPDKVLSTEWDAIFINEATELELQDWQTLKGCLRSARVPWQQIWGDCNPSTPHHWLKARCEAGVCKYFKTYHQDNPRYWNNDLPGSLKMPDGRVVQGGWTKHGSDYVEKILMTLTGHEYTRFMLGEWKSAEGVVYKYDADTHSNSIDWSTIRSLKGLKTVWSIDWGKTAPTVLQMWAYDNDGRMYLYRELYQSNVEPHVVGEWARQALDLGERIPVVILCDHDDRCRREFERTSGLSLSLADKADRDKGIEEMQGCFFADETGKPRIFIDPAGRETIRNGRKPDPWLVDRGLPTSCVDEIRGYVWDENYLKDQPIDYNDHAMDAARYAVRWIVNNGVDVGFVGPTTTVHQQMMQRRR